MSSKLTKSSELPNSGSQAFLAVDEAELATDSNLIDRLEKNGQGFYDPESDGPDSQALDSQDLNHQRSLTQHQPESHALNSSETIIPKPPARGRWLWGIVGLLGLLGLGSLTYFRVILPRLASQPPNFGPLQVTLANPTSAPVQESADYVATLDSRTSVAVQPQGSGRVTQVWVSAGDRVKAGTPLLQLDAARQTAQVAGRQAAIDAANADMVASQADVVSATRTLDVMRATRDSRVADLKFQQDEYKRFQALYDQGATSLQSLQERKNTWTQAQAALAEADAQMSAQEAVIARTQANAVRSRQQRDEAIANANQERVDLGNFTVRAPIEGMVGEIPIKVGDVVNESTPLLTLTQNQNLEVNIEVPQERVDRLQLGLPVQLIGANNQILTTGTVSFIAPNVSADTQSVQVKARFPNQDGQLRTNQFVKARIVWTSRQGVLVPTSAISRLAGKNFVFVAQPYGTSECRNPDSAASQGAKAPPQQKQPDNQLVAVQIPVQLGPIIDNSQVISAGLKTSDRIITTGLLQLKHCAPIQAAP